MELENAFTNSPCDSKYSEHMCANPYQTPEDMHVLRETHKYIFFGPSKKDLKNTYFQAVYLFEKKLRIQAGQRVVLTHNSKEEYGVALVGQAQNRQVWVWLVSFQTEDVVKRLIVQVSAITGQQTPEEQEICRNSLSRYQRKSSSYAAYAAVTSSPSSTSENSSPNRTPLSTRRLRSQALKTDRELRPKRKPKFNRRSADDSENSEDDDFYYSSSPSFSNSATNSPIISARELHEAADKKDHRLEHGELFMTLLECVVMTLAKEYPQSDEMND